MDTVCPPSVSVDTVTASACRQTDASGLYTVTLRLANVAKTYGCAQRQMLKLRRADRDGARGRYEMLRHKILMGVAAAVLATSASMALGTSALAGPMGHLTANPNPVTARDGIVHFRLVGHHLPSPGTYTLYSAQLKEVCLSQNVDGTSVTTNHAGHFRYNAEASTCATGSYLIEVDQTVSPYWTFTVSLTIQ
jgi:hypothetical protein